MSASYQKAGDREPVVFRVWPAEGGAVIALFPDFDAGRGLCQSFMHVGQHGGADYSLVMRHTRPATPAEYRDLKKELESPPYRYKLRVIKRWTQPRNRPQSNPKSRNPFAAVIL